MIENGKCIIMQILHNGLEDVRVSRSCTVVDRVESRW